MQPDEKIVAAGTWGFNSLVTRLTATGELDDTFGLPAYGGSSLIYFEGANDSRLNSVAITASGNIIAVGNAGNNIAFACLTANGTLNSQFSDDGKLTTTLSGLYSNQANGVNVQADGKIIVVGNATTQIANTFANSFLTARFKMDGL